MSERNTNKEEKLGENYVKTMRKLLKHISSKYILYIYIYLRTAHKNHDHTRKEKTSWERSVRPRETLKMWSSKLRQMKNIYNKKKWRVNRLEGDPQFDYHKSYPHWTLLWGLLSFYLTHLMRSLMLGCSSNTLIPLSSTNMSIRGCLHLALGLRWSLLLSSFWCHSSLLKIHSSKPFSFMTPSLRLFLDDHSWCPFLANFDLLALYWVRKPILDT